MCKMHNLDKNQTQAFKSAVRKSKSSDKLMASEFIKLKKPLFQDYLLKVKRHAGTSAAPKQNAQSMEIPKIPNKMIRSNSSHYYCEANELLSLKQFVILMEESRKRTFLQNKAKQRQQERRLRQSVSKHMQQNNEVNLRLTTSYVTRILKNNRKSIY